MPRRAPLSRRRFLVHSAAATVAGRYAAQPMSLSAAPAETRPALGPLCIFAKPLQWLSFAEVGGFLASIDADAIEATIRKGGQIEPADASEKIPQLVDALADHGKRVVLFASDINDPSQPHTERVLRTAAAAGIRYYRMKYYRYDLDQPILPQLDRFARQLESLAALNQQLGMTAVYQNHAGARYVGAPVWDLHRLLASLPPTQVAAAFDIRHATAGGGASWPIQWRLMRPHTKVIYVKDFHWVDGKAENVPLGEGHVDPRFFRELREDPVVDAPVSLHMEYVDHRKPERIAQSREAIRRDRQRIGALLGI